jgi:branched-chain amino acid transport system substrate-binding protein
MAETRWTSKERRRTNNDGRRSTVCRKRSTVSCPLLAVLCVLVLLTSCASPGGVPRTVKIGLSAPFEGLFRDLGYEALYAVRLAVRERNETSDMGEQWQVELVATNDFNEPREAVAQVAEMAADPDVLGVVGGLSPRTAVPAVAEYERRGIPFFTPNANPERLGQEAALFVARHLRAQSAVIVSSDARADRDQATGFAQAFVGEGGEVLASSVPQAEEDVAALLSELPEMPDVLFLAADTPTASEWIRAARKAGFGGSIMGGPDVGSDLTVEIAGSASDGVFFISPFPYTPEDPSFRSAYAALSGGADPGPVAAWSYSAARDMLAALDAGLREGTKPSRAGVSAALTGRLTPEPVLTVFVIRDGEVFTPAGD